MTTDTPAWVSRSLLITGLLAAAAGTIDPLEGSLVILGGFILVAFAASLRNSRYRNGLLSAVLLVALGVAVMFVLSAYGGVGGTSSRSAWWALLILPYPMGWIVGVVESIHLVRERRHGSDARG